MSSEGLLFLVETPTASAYDVDQLRGLGLMSRARHSKFAGLHRESAPTADSSVTGSACPAASNEASSASVPQAGPVRSAPSSTHHAGRSYKRQTPLTGNAMTWAAHAPRRVSAGCRVHVTAEQVDFFQGQLEDIDNASLMQSGFQYETYPAANGKIICDLFYTVNLILDNDEGDVAPKKGREYKLAVDTGDSSFWFFEQNFQQLQSVRLLPEELTGDGRTHKWITTDWSNQPLISQQRCRRRRVIPPSAAPMAEVSMLKYGDGGQLRVKRWHSNPVVDLYFKAPVWNWVSGESELSPNNRLQFARVLTDALTLTTAVQGVDGNLGLGVPGWRAPWFYVGSKDRATFFDVLNHGPGSVPKPMCATLRLLPPNEYELARANPRVQSFLYYGIGSPCGFLGIFEKIVIPKYTQPLYIFPDWENPDMFRHWTLQLLSVSLLEPMVDGLPNYEGNDPLQWFPKRIPLGDISRDGSPFGVRVIIDSGSTCSVLPRSFLQAMWTEWFLNDAQSYPWQPAFLRHNRDFSKHDVLFEFQDCSKTTVTLRCSAQDFLGSPWVPDDGSPGTLACFTEPDPSPLQEGPYILGANFFWTSIVRLDGTHRGDRPVAGQTAPYVQFAPQRILNDGLKIAGPFELEIHADLPPEMQAVLRDQPELRA